MYTYILLYPNFDSLLKTEIFSALRSTYIYRYDTNISLKLCETFHTPKVEMETSFKRDTRLSRMGVGWR